jgi:hypothetical protein
MPIDLLLIIFILLLIGRHLQGPLRVGQEGQHGLEQQLLQPPVGKVVDGQPFTVGLV